MLSHTEHNPSPAHFSAELPAAPQARVLASSGRILLPVRCEPYPLGSFPRLSCSEVTPLPGSRLQDPTIREAKQGKPFLARE